MERHGKIFCDRCNLLIFPAQRAHRLVREPHSGESTGKIEHYHARDIDDCWTKHLDEIKTAHAKVLSCRPGITPLWRVQ